MRSLVAVLCTWLLGFILVYALPGCCASQLDGEFEPTLGEFHVNKYVRDLNYYV